MPRLFEPNLVYPSDREGGRFVELDGDIIEVGEPLFGSLVYVSVKVRTEKGDFGGFYGFPPSWLEHLQTQGPKVGHRATIRVYDAGGGWYPDNKITSWGTSASYVKDTITPSV